MFQSKKNSVLQVSLYLMLLGVSAPIFAMVFDNRYIPLIQYPYITVSDRDSHITGDFFVTTAGEAADERERSIGIAELSGPFDQAQLAYSICKLPAYH